MNATERKDGGVVTERKPEVKTTTKERVKHNPMYRVLIHNDDVTTFQFVIDVLVSIFKRESNEAVDIAMEAHKSGVALVVVLPLEVAELRVDQAKSKSRAAKYPLTFSYEPE